MNLSTFSRKTSQKKHRQVGRGGKRGKTSGRGMKGQKARAGRRMRPELRDIIKKLPKRRGHGKNRARTVIPRKAIAVINLAALNTSTLTEVTKDTIIASGLASANLAKNGVKVLGTGDITRKIQVTGLLVSASAKEKIEKAGGSVV